MPGLTQDDLRILSAYARQENRELYWNYLAHKDGNDGYGLLALGVVRNDNAPGATANIFADNRARDGGIRMSEREWNQFGVNLMRRDLDERRGQLDAGHPDLALNLPVRDAGRMTAPSKRTGSIPMPGHHASFCKPHGAMAAKARQNRPGR